ncbi:uncharacterized protein LOC102155720 [Canis lupus familiaris]|uniref:uncharacterized protein LOC102155720 n=1 Tax=Canis lupus familiaris TaxID=9615 RepID=UPI0018F454AA|nr:uncharacterized protein LOC102155720 [Canis lupus familiaris]XP_038546536.1 uncharacterized protein LOC102155720 [Canis lupus familiaris]
MPPPPCVQQTGRWGRREGGDWPQVATHVAIESNGLRREGGRDAPAQGAREGNTPRRGASQWDVHFIHKPQRHEDSYAHGSGSSCSLLSAGDTTFVPGDLPGLTGRVKAVESENGEAARVAHQTPSKMQSITRLKPMGCPLAPCADRWDSVARIRVFFANTDLVKRTSSKGDGGRAGGRGTPARRWLRKLLPEIPIHPRPRGCPRKPQAVGILLSSSCGSTRCTLPGSPSPASVRIIPSMRGRSPEFPGQCPGCPACPACPGDDVEATASLRPQNNWRYSGQRFILRETWFLRFVEIIIRVDG